MLSMTKTDNGYKVIGDVDLATAEEFEKPILELIDAGINEIELDLTDMEYIDSTAIGILMNMKKNVLAPGQDIILIHPKRSILKLLQLTGVDQVFNIQK